MEVEKCGLKANSLNIGFDSSIVVIKGRTRGDVQYRGTRLSIISDFQDIRG